MRKIGIVFLLLIGALVLFSFLLTGCTTCNKPYIKVGNSCCLDNNDNGICDKDENIAKEKPTQEVNLSSDEYQFNVSESKMLSQWGKEVTLVNMDNEGKIIVKVNDVTREIKETNYMEIIDGLEITSKRINYDYVDPSKNYVILKIDKYTEGPNEYLVNIDKPIYVKGNTILFKEVDTKDHSIQVSVNGKSYIRIREGYTENVEGLQITNVKSFPRDIRYENYVILKII